MMFATCNIVSAIKFLGQGYPQKNISSKTCPILCKSLLDDVVRIADPKFHTLAITSGNNYTDNLEKLMQEIMNEVENAPQKLSNDKLKEKQIIDNLRADVIKHKP